MGWITLAQAQAGAGTTALTNAAAKLIAAWLDGVNAGFAVSYNHPTQTAYSRDGIDFKQELDVEVREYRGLAKDLAEFLARYLGENTTCRWTMYGLTATGDVQEVEATYGPPRSVWADTLYYYAGGTGSAKQLSDIHTKLGAYYYPPSNGVLVEASSQRSNPADGWMVRVARTEYIAPAYASFSRAMNKAFIPLPPTEAWNGIEVSRSAQKIFVAYDADVPVYQNTSTVVKEYRYLTKSQADAKVASETASNSRTLDARVTVTWGTSGNTYKYVTVRGGGSDGTTAATDKVAVSRPQGGGLHTVSVTEITYQVTTS